MVVPLAFGLRHLLIASWPVDTGTLAAHVPDALSVDEYDGSGWLSVVAFTNVDVRPRGVPKRLGIAFREVNLRTYVARDGTPGVYFLSLDVQGILGVVGGRLAHHLPYYYARIRFRRRDGRTTVSSRRLHPGARPARLSVSYRPTGRPFVAESGSLAEFLAERRRLYTQDATGSLRWSGIEHDRWTLYPASMSVAENTLFEASGFDRPDAEPTLYYSPGVDVVASRSEVVPPG